MIYHSIFIIHFPMALAEFLAELDASCPRGDRPLRRSRDAAALEAARIQFLGARSGRLKGRAKGPWPSRQGRQARRRQAVQRGQAADRGGVRGGDRATGSKRPRQGGSATLRSHGARRSSAPGPPAPDHADDRGIEGHHGPAGVHRGRRAGSGRPLAQFRGLEHPPGASGPRSAGEFLFGGCGEKFPIS